ELIIGVIGMMLGLITSSLIVLGLPNSMPEKVHDLTKIYLHLFFGYFGVQVALRNAHKFDFSTSSFLKRSEDRLFGCKILDTSVLIDGRITEISEAGFIEGLVVIPAFVVNELQILADSKDPMKRSKGRRGLDISKRMQKISRCEVEILEEDYPNLPEVDKKLLTLAKRYEGTLLTVDFNLNKVAEIEQISVLNINLLAQSLKTIVLPGEKLSVQVIREGKEAGQGVGYLDDGTMVVVENGKRFLGQEVQVAVASVLQTSAGRLIFTRMVEPNHQNGGNPKDKLQKESA
ncbi:MAG: PIN/TRAM domain-containing protein, partial [Candidatus Hinthialibacter sp.]